MNVNPVDESRESVCPLCEVAGAVDWRLRGTERYLRCPTCGVAFRARTDRDSVSSYDSYYDYAKTWDRARVEYEADIRRWRLRWQLARIETLVERGLMVEIGAGPGYFCAEAVRRGWRVMPVELNAIARMIGERFFGLKYCELSEVAPSSADVVCLFHVLEHLSEPVQFLASLRQRARPGALAVVHVPHQEPLSYLLRNSFNRMVGVNGSDVTCLYGDEHLTGFTPRSLSLAAGKAGWRTLHVTTASGWSRYYDPFFIRNLIGRRDLFQIVRKCARYCIDGVGTAAGRGDWIVGYFVRDVGD